MAIQFTANLRDSFGRLTKKRIETTATTLTDAATYATAWAGAMADVSDLALESIEFHSRSNSDAYAGVAGANVDVGATFKLQLTDSSYASHKIPGFKTALVDSTGGVDVAGTEVATYFALFEAGGHLRLSDGESIVAPVYGELDR